MLDTLNQIDTSVFLFFNGMHTLFFDKFMMLFTGRFIWIPMYAAILLVIIKTFGLKKTGIYVIAIALAITLTDQTCATIIRPVVERLRPSNLENPLSALTTVVNDYRGGSYGFPSCHSANSFALAMTLTCIFQYRKLSLFIFIWALINSYTRLYLGVHYPGDLLIGAIIGTCYGFLCAWLARLCDTNYRNAIASKNVTAPLFTLKFKKQNGTLAISAVDVMLATATIIILYILVAASIA